MSPLTWLENVPTQWFHAYKCWMFIILRLGSRNTITIPSPHWYWKSAHVPVTWTLKETRCWHFYDACDVCKKVKWQHFILTTVLMYVLHRHLYCIFSLILFYLILLCILSHSVYSIIKYIWTIVEEAVKCISLCIPSIWPQKTFFGMNKALSSFLSNQQKLFVSHSTTDLVA